MRSTFTLALFITTTCFAMGCGGATPQPTGPGAAPPAAEAKAETKAKANVKAHGEAQLGDTTTCPVSGEEFVVSATSPKVERDGKTYYFCCPGCAKKFEADPAKFMHKPTT